MKSGLTMWPSPWAPLSGVPLPSPPRATTGTWSGKQRRYHGTFISTRPRRGRC